MFAHVNFEPLSYLQASFFFDPIDFSNKIVSSFIHTKLLALFVNYRHILSSSAKYFITIGFESCEKFHIFIPHIADNFEDGVYQAIKQFITLLELRCDSNAHVNEYNGFQLAKGGLAIFIFDYDTYFSSFAWVKRKVLKRAHHSIVDQLLYAKHGYGEVGVLFLGNFIEC